MSERPPLPVAVSRSIGAITRAHDGAAPPGSPTLSMRAALLRFAPDGTIASRDLPARSRLSSRTARVVVEAAAQRGWVTVGSDPDRPRRPSIRFTDDGIAAGAAADAMLAAAEDPWLRGAGDEDVLRRSAEALVGGLDLELPHHPISYGTGDLTITGGSSRGRAGRDGRAGDRDPRLPPHGADWRPVLRTDPSSAIGLPITALLSQVLVQFTIDYDRRGGINRHSAVQVLRFIGDAGVPLDALPGAGITGGGRSYFERHGLVQVDGSSKGGERTVRLTPAGRHLRDALDPLTATIEAEWRSRYGAELLDTFTAELVARRSSWLAADDRGATPDDHVVVGLHVAGLRRGTGAADDTVADEVG